MHRKRKSDLLLMTFVLLCGAYSAAAQVTNEQCLSCHEAQRKYLGTAHHLTSQPATANSIAGSFAPGKNILKTTQRELSYRMEARQDGFFQTGVLGTPPDTISIAERFDLVIGSGRKGQTYLYWGKEDQLFQLPVSYWTEVGSWVNSPGYGDRTIEFSRPVVPRCLECHATYFEPRIRIRESISQNELHTRYLMREVPWSR